MKGILRADRRGAPALQTLHDMPLIFHSLAALLRAGIREAMVIAAPRDLPALQQLLGGGARWGAALCYAPAACAGARALGVASEFLAGAPAMLALAGGIFHGRGFAAQLRHAAALKKGAHAFACDARDDARRALVRLDVDGNPRAFSEGSAGAADYALPGLYCYDAGMPARARALPRAAGLAELNRAYLAEGELRIEMLGAGVDWRDAASPDALRDAAEFVRRTEMQTGAKVGCPEEAAWRGGLIDDAQLREMADAADAAKDAAHAAYLRALPARGPARE